MATFIWIALGATWAWHAIDLFQMVDPNDLPRRARQHLGCVDVVEPLTAASRLRLVPPRRA